MRTIRSATVCLVVVLVSTQSLFADEPAARFLDALRDKGYYDIALEYLDKAKNNPSVPEDFRERISYEKAVTLIDQVGQLSDRKKIDLQLDAAQQLLADYAANNSSLVETARSLSFRSRLLSMRADVYLKDAEATQLTESERQEIQTNARGFLQESIKTADNALATAFSLLDPTPGNKDALKISADDPRSRQLVNEMRTIYRRMKVQRPFSVEQFAYTFPKRSPERKQYLQDAAGVYKEICEGSYSNTEAGLRACLHAGLCYQQLGSDEEALDFFKQVISQTRSSSIESLQKRAFAAAGDSWEKIKPYPARSVIAQLEPVVDELSRSENRDPAWLRVKLELGIAKYEMSKIVREEGGPNAVTRSKSVKREAGRMVRDVTRVKNPFRDRARTLLEEWDVPLIESAELSTESGEPESFAAALEAGQDQISSIELLAGEVVRARAAEKSAPKAEREEQATEADSLGTRLREQADQTISTMNLALSMASPNTSSDEINTCRFFQSYCYFVTERHLEVSVIGQYLLKRHPNAAGTKPAAGLLLKSRSSMYASAPKDDNQTELRSLKNTALEIAKRWPGTAEAGDAISQLIQISIREGDMPQAVELMGRLPSDNAQRPLLAAIIGQQLWRTYQQDKKDPQLSVNTNEMNKKLDESVRFLKVAESLIEPESISFSDAVTGLNLVDSMLEMEQPEEALKMLESSPMSPLQILKSQTPAVLENSDASDYKSNAYSVIIKTYLAKLATAQNQQVWIDRSNGVIELMKQEAEESGSPDAKRQLTAIYYLISVELRRRFDNTNDPQERIQLANALGDFLTGLEETSTSSRVLLNAASALMSMATSLSESGATAEAQGFFVKSSKALAKAGALGFDGDASKDALNRELKRQQALAQRGAGQYDKAVTTFTALLKESKSLPMQLDAAATLQQWGKSAGLSTQLAQAVNGTGSFEDPKTKRRTNAIWGWGKIMRLTQSNKPKYREQYFTAAFGIAEAIYEQGKAQGRDAKQKALARIKKERNQTPAFLGSKIWKDKFSDLENRINNDG